MSNGAAVPTRDALDDKVNRLFAGKVVRKDLVRKVKVGANVPVFVLEFLLGKYCASSDEVAIQMGLQVVNDTLANNYIRPDESAKAQSKVKENGKYTFIDKVKVRLVDSDYWAEAVTGHRERSGVVADWFAKRIADGALPSGADTTIREDLRAAWRGIIDALPVEWVVDAPIASQQAISELASRGIVGDGLLPIPLGRRADKNRASRPDPQRLDGALLELGKLLVAGQEGASQTAQRARLILAETLLSVRDDRPLGEELAQLPLLRAHKLPEERDDAWSVSQLRQHTPP